jgi:hypothetical protein
VVLYARAVAAAINVRKLQVDGQAVPAEAPFLQVGGGSLRGAGGVGLGAGVVVPRQLLATPARCAPCRCWHSAA